MKYRFSQCRQIAHDQIDESLRLMALSVKGEIGEKEQRVIVSNPLASPIDQPIDLALQIPTQWGTYNEFFGFEPKPAFRIYTEMGEEIPYQLLSQEMNRTQRRLMPLKFTESYKTHTITVAAKIQLPPLGYRTLTIREGKWTEREVSIDASVLPTRHPQVPSMVTSERTMENEYLSVTIESNGTLTVTDRRTKETYQRLLTFEDTADIGDGWYHGVAVNDQCFVSSSAQSDVALIHDGAQLARFRVRTRLNVPKDYVFQAHIRADDLVPLTIDSLVTMRAGSDRLEIFTTVDNNAKDHRLRVLFPSGTHSESYLADGAFDVVERAIGLPKDGHLRRELPVETTPQQSWTAVTDDKRGLAIVSAGLMESTVRDLPERPIALTLFRSTRRTVLKDGEPGGQLLGPLSFHYWIMPLAQGVNRRKVFDQGLLLSAGLRTTQVCAFDRGADRRPETLPPLASYLHLEGAAVLSSVRYWEDCLEVRLFNPEVSEIRASLDFSGWPEGIQRPVSVHRVDLESSPLSKDESMNSNSPYDLNLKAKEIVTLRFAFGS